jgi:hypothetical protein
MPPLSAFTASLPSDVLLGTGILVTRGFDNAGLTPIGVTNGGLNWDPKRELRNIPFDGKLFDIEQLDWETGGTPTFTGTFIQLGPTQLPRFEPGIGSASGSGNVTTVHTPYKAGLLYVAQGYIDNLCQVFGRVSGGYVQIRMFKALCTEYSWAGKNKEEALIQATFVARQPLSQAVTDLGTKPYVIEELSALS